MEGFTWYWHDQVGPKSQVRKERQGCQRLKKVRREIRWETELSAMEGMATKRQRRCLLMASLLQRCGESACVSRGPVDYPRWIQCAWRNPAAFLLGLNPTTSLPDVEEISNDATLEKEDLSKIFTRCASAKQVPSMKMTVDTLSKFFHNLTLSVDNLACSHNWLPRDSLAQKSAQNYARASWNGAEWL